MVKGDYGEQCQICGSTFTKHAGERQIFVVHLIEPTADDSTNHMGNLLGLCGWHYALIRYGAWSLSQFPKSPEQLLASVVEAHDDSSNVYMGLPPVRFHNVYTDWDSVPGDVHATVR